MHKEKIAVLGGGVGSMAAVFEITNQPGWQDRYDITVYQMGWRIGGKGASGRNRQIADRIQEHGLHVWMGFYENAFDMMRQAYEYCAEHNLTPDSPFPNYLDAFTKTGLAPVAEQVDGVWKTWPLFWSPNNDLPGQPNPTDVAPHADGTPWGYVRMIFTGLRSELDRLRDGEPILLGLADDLVEAMMSLAEHAPVALETHPTLLHRLEAFVFSLPHNPADHDPEHHSILLNAFRKLVDRLVQLLTPFAGKHDKFRRFLIILDTAFGFVHGMLSDGILTQGFGVIENEDFVEWLARHGCRAAKSPLTRAFYDGAFAYEGGDRMRPRASAGSILHGSLRLMFTYRGSVMWFMNAGMGDVVFTPFYLALRDRGVKFAFFRKVTRLTPSTDGSIDSIEIDVQAHVHPELGDYNPLVPVKNLLCWPAEPDYGQLIEGVQLQDPRFVNRDLESWWNDLPVFGKETLRRGADFDRIILGISIGALPILCKDLAEADSTGAWQGMFDHIKTVRTQAAQLWLTKTKEELGWNPGVAGDPVFCGYLEPFDTWGDETHLLPRESWEAPNVPLQNPYICSTAPSDPSQAPFSDPTYPAKQLSIVTQNVTTYLDQGSGLLWPKAIVNGKFDDTLFVNPSGVQPPIASQWIRVNIDPTELYVLSVPGSTHFRLAPWDSRFSNLILAGDWTLNDVNLGCVEGAVQSGKMAAYALTGAPTRIFGAYRSTISMDSILQNWQGKRNASRA
jgi:uncharacterized protein with NAD-binding domain and iron-sulfur cluster